MKPIVRPIPKEPKPKPKKRENSLTEYSAITTMWI